DAFDATTRRSWSQSSNESSLTVRDAPPLLDLTLLHACTHCRASKTACTDSRPCLRCSRLNLPCAYMDKPRKRACVSCHGNKVACDLHLSGQGPCSRCKRLASSCVPREQIRQRATRKRRRRGEIACGEQPADVLLLAGSDDAVDLLLGLAVHAAAYDEAAQIHVNEEPNWNSRPDLNPHPNANTNPRREEQRAWLGSDPAPSAS
ncbi:MAG: hypothetical protein SGPRY_010704, partial [Prymnesium sp.]